MKLKKLAKIVGSIVQLPVAATVAAIEGYNHLTKKPEVPGETPGKVAVNSAESARRRPQAVFNPRTKLFDRS